MLSSDASASSAGWYKRHARRSLRVVHSIVITCILSRRSVKPQFEHTQCGCSSTASSIWRTLFTIGCVVCGKPRLFCVIA
eukprot:151786-Prymnesium_polylepis.2